ncbi:hypothetical protein HMPREF9554_01123 [Treponema phagedenis F0421]|nr:hypothetical protein HMPREF9554_01123 [Treponema phagedenis F0421]
MGNLPQECLNPQAPVDAPISTGRYTCLFGKLFPVFYRHSIAD